MAANNASVLSGVAVCRNRRCCRVLFSYHGTSGVPDGEVVCEACGTLHVLAGTAARLGGVLAETRTVVRRPKPLHLWTRSAPPSKRKIHAKTNKLRRAS